MDLSHLNALELGLSHERARYAVDKSELRKVWIAQREREIEAERRFLAWRDRLHVIAYRLELLENTVQARRLAP